MARPHARVAALRLESNPPQVAESYACGHPNAGPAYGHHTPTVRSLLKPRMSNRGKKPLSVSSSVERGLVRLINYTTVPFDKLAEAVEQAKGPSKQWLRKHMTKITGTKRFGELRLARSDDTEKRKEEQLRALNAASTISDERPLDSQRFGSELAEHGLLTRSIETFPYAPLTDSNHDLGDVLIFSESQTSSLIGQASVESTATKRRYTDDSEDHPVDKANKYAKKKHLANILSMTSITRHLEEILGAEPGYFPYIGKRCSATAETIASRVSLDISSRSSTGLWTTSTGAPSARRMRRNTKRERTAHSEYKEFYHSLVTAAAPAAGFQEVFNRRNADEATANGDSPVVSAILSARTQRMSDEDAGTYLQRIFPNDNIALEGYVNIADEHGTTALHLAVSFGWPRVCSLLLQAGADFRAVTREGTSVSRFAKPAQTLARDDIPLYDRIARCRKWVERGGSPPVSSETNWHYRGQQIRKHNYKEEAYDFSVESFERRSPTTDSAFHNITQDSRPTNSSELESQPARHEFKQPTQDSTEDPHYVRRFTDSPTSIRKRRDFQNRSDSFDFASCKTKPPKTAFRSFENISTSLIPGNPLRPKVNLTSSTVQYAPIRTSSLRYASGVDYSSAAGPSVQQAIAPAVSSLSSTEPTVTPGFTSGTAGSGEWIHGSMGHQWAALANSNPTNLQRLPRALEHGFRIHPHSSMSGFQPQKRTEQSPYYLTHNSLQIQPHARFGPQWIAAPSPIPLSSVDNSNLTIQTSPTWELCEHFCFVSYDKSYCDICPPPIWVETIHRL